MANAGDIKIKLELESKEFKAAMKRAEKAADKFVNSTLKGFKKIKSAAKRMGSAIKRSIGVIKKAFIALAAVFGGGALLGKMVTNLAGVGREITNWSKALGVSTTALQKFSAASNVVGFGFEKTTDILKDVSEKIGEFIATGGGEAKDVFERLGLSGDDLKGKSPIKAIEIVMAKMQELKNLTGQEKISFTEALANDMSKLIPLYADGSKKLKQFMNEATKSGAVLSPEDLTRLDKFDSLSRVIALQWKGVKNTFSIGLLPIMTKLAKKLKAAFDSGKIKRYAEILADKIEGGFNALLAAMPTIISAFKTWVSILGDALGIIKNILQTAIALRDLATLKTLTQTNGIQDNAVISSFNDKYALSGVERTSPGPEKTLRKSGAMPQKFIDLIERMTNKANAEEKGVGGWVDSFGSHVQAFGEASAASKTAIGKILAGRGKANLNEILGSGAPQIKSEEFNRIARLLVKGVEDGSATARFNEHMLNKLRTITHVAAIGDASGSTSGLVGAIKELQLYIKAKDKDAERIQVDVDVLFNEPMFSAKVVQSISNQMNKETRNKGT